MANILEDGPIRRMLREKGLMKRQEEVLKGFSLEIRLFENSAVKDDYISLPLPKERAEQLFREIQSKLAYASR